MAEHPKPLCFIAMPVTTRDHEAERYGDELHWKHVIDSLFVRAIEAAGYEPVRPVAQGAHLIHELIIKNLETCEMVLCDLSGHNPNVFFELGVRTSLNKPIALVKDEFTDLPFDTSGINTHTYKSTLHGWDMETEREGLRRHLEESASSCRGENPLWRKFGLTLKAQEPSTEETPIEAKLDLILNRIPQLEAQLSDEAELNSVLRNEISMIRDQNVALMHRRPEFERHSPAPTGHELDASAEVGKDLFADEVRRILSKFPVRSYSILASKEELTITIYGPEGPQAAVMSRLEELAAMYGIPVVVDWVLKESDDSNAPSVRRRIDPLLPRGTRRQPKRDIRRGGPASPSTTQDIN